MVDMYVEKNFVNQFLNFVFVKLIQILLPFVSYGISYSFSSRVSIVHYRVINRNNTIEARKL